MKCVEGRTMTTTQIREIKRRKGTQLAIEWIKQFEKEWDTTVASIKQSGADLSKIILTEEPIRGQIKQYR